MFKGIKGRIYRGLSFTVLKNSQQLYNFLNKKSINTSPQGIAVIHTMGLGDAMLCEPAIHAIKKQYPSAKIILITTAYTKDLFVYNPAVDEILCYNETSSWKEYFSLIKKLRCRKINAVFDFQNTFFSWKRTLLSFFSGAKTRVGFKREAYRGFLNTVESEALKHKHETSHYLSLLPFYNEKGIPLPALYFSKNEKVKINALLKEAGSKPIVAVHPCNLNPLKQWKAEYIADIINYCSTKHHATCIITGTPAFKSLFENIKSYTKKEPIFFTNLSVRDYALLISAVDLLISVDTSAVHIATATRTKTIVLFGPTDDVCWKPANEKMQKVIQLGLSCQPCEKTVYTSIQLNTVGCPFAENYCLTQLFPETVKSYIDAFLQQ